MGFLAGKKTYIVALIAGVVAAAQALGYEIPEWIMPLLGALGLGTMRQAIARL